MCWRSRPMRGLRDVRRVGGVDRRARARPRRAPPCRCRCTSNPAAAIIARLDGTSNGAGWTIIAAWTPSKAPRSSSRILPPPFTSSAGVPITVIVRSTSSATALRPSAGADRSRRDQVVAAGVADAGQRVVLGADARRAAGPSRSAARNAVGRSQMPRLDVEAGSVSVLGDPRRRALLLMTELGMGVDPVAETRPGARAALDLGRHALLEVAQLSAHCAKRIGLSNS